MITTRLAILGIVLSSAWAMPVPAQCNPECQGDFNNDGRVGINEIVIAVNNTLNDCGETPAEACRAAGGTVMSGPCCTGVGDFPNTCNIGPCGCAPQNSETVQLCDCPTNRCFNGHACIVR